MSVNKTKPLYVICDSIRSLENIGSIFRTSDALGASKIFLCGYSARPPVGENIERFLKRKISKTSLGAEKNILFEYCSSTSRLIDRLKNSLPGSGQEKINIVALEQNKKAILYTKFKPSFPLALILGNEVKGISKKVLAKADEIICLPMEGEKESLNVSVAFGVAGYKINERR